jgi:hypothetical protein
VGNLLVGYNLCSFFTNYKRHEFGDASEEQLCAMKDIAANMIAEFSFSWMQIGPMMLFVMCWVTVDAGKHEEHWLEYHLGDICDDGSDLEFHSL